MTEQETNELVVKAMDDNDAFTRLVESIGIPLAVEAVVKRGFASEFTKGVERNPRDGSYAAVLLHACGNPECRLSRKSAFLFTEEEAWAYVEEMYSESETAYVKRGIEMVVEDPSSIG